MVQRFRGRCFWGQQLCNALHRLFRCWISRSEMGIPHFLERNDSEDKPASALGQSVRARRIAGMRFYRRDKRRNQRRVPEFDRARSFRPLGEQSRSPVEPRILARRAAGGP